MARERESIKFAALAFPPCYLFTGLVYFFGFFFFLFLFLQAVSLHKHSPLISQERRFEMYFQMQNSPYKEEGPCNQRIPQYEGLVGAINLA